MRFRKPFIILPIISFLVVSNVKIYAEDEISVGPEEKIYYDTWSNLFSISQESIEEYLPEEEDADVIRARRFNTEYTADERKPVPWSVNVIGT